MKKKLISLAMLVTVLFKVLLQLPRSENLHPKTKTTSANDTAMTGSDFDVDKLYLATLNYDENGNISFGTGI